MSAVHVHFNTLGPHKKPTAKSQEPYWSTTLMRMESCLCGPQWVKRRQLELEVKNWGRWRGGRQGQGREEETTMEMETPDPYE